MKYVLSFVLLLSQLLFLSACSEMGLSESAADQNVRAGIQAVDGGEYQEGVDKLLLALENPDDITSEDLDYVYTVLGNAYNELDEFELAIEAHLNALDLNPENYQAWVNLGVVYRLIGDLDKAEESYLSAMALEPEYPELRASLGALYIFRGEPERALEELDYAIELDDSLAISHANRAITLAMLGRFDEADESLDMAIVRGYGNAAAARDMINNLRGE